MSVPNPPCLTRRSVLASGVVASLPFACASAKLPPSRASKHLGAALPAFSGTTVNGSEFDSNSSRGMVLLVEFFECDAGSRGLADAAELYTNERELVVVGVSFDDSIERTRAFVAQREVKFPILFDPKRSVAALVGVTDPKTILAIDRRGILRWVGDPTKAGAVEQATQALLDETA